MSALTFGSVCSGIGAPELAWSGLGWDCAFMSEIAPAPRAVLKHHYPDVPLHGDFTTIKGGEYRAIDLLVGGTPCQAFSVAGLRGGMADARGNLALEYLRLAERLRPRWLVWENVPGVRSSGAGRDFGAFLGGLGELGYGWPTEALTLSMPVWPSDASVCSLSDILETGAVPPRYYLSPRACAGILRRAEKRGKELPEALRAALQQVADLEPTSTSPADCRLPIRCDHIPGPAPIVSAISPSAATTREAR